MGFSAADGLRWGLMGFKGVAVDQCIAILTMKLPCWSIHHPAISGPTLNPQELLG